MQRLAVITRDGGRCAFPGCDCSYERCDIHHTVNAAQGGHTDIDVLALLCPPHHTYLHLNKLCLIRDGTGWKVVPQPTHWQDTG